MRVEAEKKPQEKPKDIKKIQELFTSVINSYNKKNINILFFDIYKRIYEDFFQQMDLKDEILNSEKKVELNKNELSEKYESDLDNLKEEEEQKLMLLKILKH